jgi:hypothetical protein
MASSDTHVMGTFLMGQLPPSHATRLHLFRAASSSAAGGTGAEGAGMACLPATGLVRTALRHNCECPEIVARWGRPAGQGARARAARRRRSRRLLKT